MSDGRRRTALALHGLATADREWLLAQLPATERDGLDTLLRELRELGIPPEPLPVDVLHASPPSQPPSPSTPEERVAAAGAARIAAILAPEPCGLIAHFLALQPPSRRDELLRALPRRARPAVTRHLESLSGAPRAEKLHAAIVQAIDARLDAPMQGARWWDIARRWSQRRAA